MNKPRFSVLELLVAGVVAIIFSAHVVTAVFIIVFGLCAGPAIDAICNKNKRL